MKPTNMLVALYLAFLSRNPHTAALGIPVPGHTFLEIRLNLSMLSISIVLHPISCCSGCHVLEPPPLSPR